MIKIKIDNRVYIAEIGETILDVAKREHIDIPTLCYLKGENPTSNCRMCLVEVVGQRNLVTACSFKVYDGMEVITNSVKVFSARKMNLELLLSNHNYDCKNCVREGNCDLAKYAQEYNATGFLFNGEKTQSALDDSNACIVRDSSKCILCKKCTQVCSKRQEVHAICETKRGFSTRVGCAFENKLKNSTCVGCGQCIMVCPTGALHESFNIMQLEEILSDKSKHKVVAPAPAVRVALLENFQIDPVMAEQLIPSIFRKLGFDKVFDINFGADLTIIEETAEFLERYKSKMNLPMFTSCCPAWVDYVNKFYPEIKKNVSSCKSPLMMFGAIVKSYYAEKINLSADKISMVSVMPCTAKKGERLLDNDKDVDCVITVRELLYLIKKHGIDVTRLKPSKFDSVLGESSGAGVIFGASGGVMEAAIRTIADKVYNQSIQNIDYTSVRGFDDTKFASIKLGGDVVNIAVVSGLGNAKRLLEKIKSKEIDVQFVEVMSCPGGCINGGGMPLVKDTKLIESRMKGLYKLDSARNIRKSHENKEVQEFLKWQRSAKKKTKLHTR